MGNHGRIRDFRRNRRRLLFHQVSADRHGTHYHHDRQSSGRPRGPLRRTARYGLRLERRHRASGAAARAFRHAGPLRRHLRHRTFLAELLRRAPLRARPPRVARRILHAGRPAIHLGGISEAVPRLPALSRHRLHQPQEAASGGADRQERGVLRPAANPKAALAQRPRLRPPHAGAGFAAALRGGHLLGRLRSHGPGIPVEAELQGGLRRHADLHRTDDPPDSPADSRTLGAGGERKSGIRACARPVAAAASRRNRPMEGAVCRDRPCERARLAAKLLEPGAAFWPASSPRGRRKFWAGCRFPRRASERWSRGSG